MKKIIFDLDNTLLFLAQKWDINYQKFIDKYKLKTTPEELYSAIDVIEMISINRLVTDEQFIKKLSKILSIDFTCEMYNSFLDYYADIPLLHTDVVYDVLLYLSQSYELIAYSNWPTDNQIKRLRKYNLDKFFSKIYGFDKLPTKPSKDGLISIINNNSLEDYIFIGDNMKVDLEPAEKIGMNTIFFNRKNIKQDKYREISKIEELKNIL